ncbi:Hypothetical_protein [Hexamita inflata]|uniref:Hypothetical_protein n=1 Tax=Hexamita inflata TaxID=28002 RepID=A0AA86RD31_9EUKA|nr:Hypothetical protein HINF_LOCUS58567 [Hexamita inflata]
MSSVQKYQSLLQSQAYNQVLHNARQVNYSNSQQQSNIQKSSLNLSELISKRQKMIDPELLAKKRITQQLNIQHTMNQQEQTEIICSLRSKCAFLEQQLEQQKLLINQNNMNEQLHQQYLEKAELIIDDLQDKLKTAEQDLKQVNTLKRDLELKTELIEQMKSQILILNEQNFQELILEQQNQINELKNQINQQQTNQFQSQMNELTQENEILNSQTIQLALIVKNLQKELNERKCGEENQQMMGQVILEQDIVIKEMMAENQQLKFKLGQKELQDVVK